VRVEGEGESPKPKPDPKPQRARHGLSSALKGLEDARRREDAPHLVRVRVS